MTKPCVLSQIAFGALVLGLINGNAEWAQQPAPIRPQSDSTLALPGTSGTNYLRQNSAGQAELRRKLEQLTLQEWSTRNEPRFSTHIVRPSSDAGNASNEERLNLLMMQVEPAAVKPEAIVAHTNYFVVRSNAIAGTNAAQPSGVTPDDVRMIYGVPAGGGSGVIAIVDAFHYPNLTNDLKTFSQRFDLPNMPPCSVQNSFGGPGPCLRIEANVSAAVNCGWNGEAALDVEWVHAIAPNAKILYVEAASSQNADLYAAVKRARDEISGIHGEMSLSWGTNYEDTQTAVFGSLFTTGDLYFAATGDTGGQVGFPAVFPGVIAVGGTIPLVGSDGTFITEIGWPNSGGGVSVLERLPAFQSAVENTTASGRNIPDIAAMAQPYLKPGASVFVSTDATQCQDHPTAEQYTAGWANFVGTSLATPLVAAIVNVAAHGRTDVTDELKAIYSNRRDSSRVRDITLMSGSAGNNVTKVGYDNVTGVGVPASLNFDGVPQP